MLTITRTMESDAKASAQLLPGGKIYHLSFEKETVKDLMHQILEVQPLYFRKFILSPQGWKHHRLDLYRLYLASVIAGKSIDDLFV